MLGRQMSVSVRAMQYVLDMNVNAKIPDNLVHKLSFERFRIKFQCLERLPFNFKIYVISTVVLVVFNTPFLKLDRRSVYDNLYLPRVRYSFLVTSVDLPQEEESHLSFSVSIPRWKCQGKTITFLWWYVIRVTSLITANFTKISRNMPTFQSPLAKATRPMAEFYNIYMVAYGPNHQVF